jgi:transposase
MQDETLFVLPEPASAAAEAPGPGDGDPRIRFAVRDQVELVMTDLDSLVPAEHQVRIVWAFVEGQDLTPLYDLIDARGSAPGRRAIDPRILMALWLNATLDGLGSARELDRRCAEDIGYRWICGGVSVNYHTLSDFRVAHGELLDGLLTRNVASLMEQGLVDLNRVAQDGMRVRASAGAASYRRRPTLEECLAEAKTQVERLRAEEEEAPGEATKREKAARERAARERQERVERALLRSEELRAQKPEKDREKVRVSTTDPEVPVMKMGDGGFRPAANVQFATDTASQVIAGVEVTNRGTDQGEMAPMVDQVQERYGVCPPEVLVDGGFANKEDIDEVSAPEKGCTVYAPVPKPKDKERDRHKPLPGDSEAVAAWRTRMGTDAAKEIYKERAATAECVNAIARNRGLRQFTVRGLGKIRTVVLWYVLAHNMMRAHTLRTAAGAAAA